MSLGYHVLGQTKLLSLLTLPVAPGRQYLYPEGLDHLPSAASSCGRTANFTAHSYDFFFFLSHKNELIAASWLVDERVSVGMDRFSMNTGFLVSSFRRVQGSEVR